MPEPTGAPTIPEAFADRLIERVRALGHPLCAGIDPDPARLPPLFAPPGAAPHGEAAAQAALAFGRAALERVAGRVAAVKLQVAWFERLGAPGFAVLAELMQAARQRELLVIADAKRSDIAATGAAYAEAWLGAEAPFAADAVTLSPYLGIDSLEPFVAAAERAGAGLFVLVRTSNPGARDYQDLHAGALRVYERVALSLDPLAKRLLAPRTGWSSLGAVVGATWLPEARRARELLPRALFLVPGYGAQGASAREATGGFVKGPGGLEGGLVNASRSLFFPKAAAQAGDAAAWDAAVDASLERAIAELSEAVASPPRG